MKNYSLDHVSDDALLRDMAALVARDRATTAEMLAHIAEVDARKLYLPAAYPSMYAYCVGELGLSEDAAFKRIQAARAARRFPAILEAIAQGRLHLSAIGLLAAHLTEGNAWELLEAATHRTKPEIERLLAARFPRPDAPAWVQAIPAASGNGQVCQLAPAQVGLRYIPGSLADRPRVKPRAPQRFAVQFTMSQEGHDMLCHAQEPLGHQVPSGDIAEVFERSLRSLIERLDRDRFAATSSPRRGDGRSTRSPRHVPADVKRAVWERDGGRCTFESEAGRRCSSRTRLEFDHVQEVARGGEATVSGVRLRCRAHNQYGAECTFGPEFMRHKRIAASEARTAAKARATEARGTEPRATAGVRPAGVRAGADDGGTTATACAAVPRVEPAAAARSIDQASRASIAGLLWQNARS